MKKVLAFLSIIAMMGLVSCKKEPATATITASDVTVQEGSTVKITASTNSTATITYVSADPTIAAVAADGTVTGVKAGNTTVTLKTAAVKDAFTAAEKNIQVTVTAKEGGDPTPGPTGAAIEIDGEFADWSALQAGTFSKSLSDPDAPWEAVKEIRCYADPDYVFYYIKYDEEILSDLFTYPGEILPMRLNLNTDGEFTSGYANYFLEAYDFMIEGHIADNGEFCSFDGGFYQRVDGWVNLLAENSGMCCGAGSGSEYEIRLDREMFNEAAKLSTVPMPMGDDFQTSIRFYTSSVNPNWDELSNVPNSSIDEEDGTGHGYLMRVHTNK